MQDRIPTKPNRVLITPETGQPYYATVTRADEPTQEGTALNKASLLKDTTAELFGLGADAVPDDVLNQIKILLDGKPRIETGSYDGTQTYGQSYPNKLTFDFQPKLICISHENDSTYGGYPWVKDAKIGKSAISGTTTRFCNLKWGDNFVEYYADDSAGSQLNSSNVKYCYFAIG